MRLLYMVISLTVICLLSGCEKNLTEQNHTKDFSTLQQNKEETLKQNALEQNEELLVPNIEKEQNQTESETTLKESEREKDLSDRQSVSQSITNQSSSNTPIVFRSKTFPYTIQLPSSWKGSYEVEEHGTTARFYAKKGNERSYLLSIRVRAKENEKHFSNATTVFAKNELVYQIEEETSYVARENVSALLPMKKKMISELKEAVKKMKFNDLLTYPYVNKKAGFTLMLPETWKNKLQIKESNTRTTFYLKAKDGKASEVFTILLLPKGQYTANDEQEGYIYIKEKNDFVYLYAPAWGEEFAHTKYTEESIILSSMYEQINPIVKTLKITGKPDVEIYTNKQNYYTLVIPLEWKGKYRVKQEGTVTHFYYRLLSGKEKEIFSLQYFSKIEWNKEKEKYDVEFEEQRHTHIKEGTIGDAFVLHLAIDNKSKTVKEDFEINRLRSEAQNIFQTLYITNSTK